MKEGDKVIHKQHEWIGFIVHISKYRNNFRVKWQNNPNDEWTIEGESNLIVIEGEE